MVALFIVRKKSAGKSVRSPLFGTAVFYNDSEVEEFVQQHPTTSRASEVSVYYSLTNSSLLNISYHYNYSSLVSDVLKIWRTSLIFFNLLLMKIFFKFTHTCCCIEKNLEKEGASGKDRSGVTSSVLCCLHQQSACIR